MSKPVVASYCTTFLKPEMLHIYRQVTGLERYQTFVITKERRCAERYPFDDIELLPEPDPNLLWRFYAKFIRRVPPLVYRGEWELMMSLVNRREPDLMHVYFGHTGVHLVPFLEAWQRPAVVSFHGADVMLREHKPQYAVAMRRMFAHVPLVLARSRSLMARLEEIGAPTEKLRLNRTGIPLTDFPFIERCAPTDGAWRLVQTCRLIPKKGLLTALEAFARFHAQFPKSTYTIAGKGPMLAELQKRVVELHLEDAVKFPGFLRQAELNVLYSQAHVFLHPSERTAQNDQEGIPNSMLEAMATGLPVVATLHGGIPEAVESGRSGWLVAERDSEALTDALLKIASTSEMLQTFGKQAAESVRAEFEQRRAIQKLEDCYDEALAISRKN